MPCCMGKQGSVYWGEAGEAPPPPNQKGLPVIVHIIVL